jgi:hypothetical protein
MSNIWDNDEPFHDGAPVFRNGKYEEPETYTPVPETMIPNNTVLVTQVPAQNQDEYNLDELTEQVSLDDDEDYSEVLSDARLRLEQGKLYELIMNHDLFNDVDADPRAAKSVQKQIRKWAKTQMEIMLGMTPDPSSQPASFISSPFNDLEVTVLKKLASAASKGATESEEANTVSAPPAPVVKKKTTLNSIGPSKTKPQVQPTKPIQKKAEPIKRESKPKQPEINQKGLLTGKTLAEMTEEEKQEKIKENIERNRGKIATSPNRLPQPDYATREMLAYSQVSRATAPGKGNLSAAIMASLKGSGKI